MNDWTNEIRMAYIESEMAKQRVRDKSEGGTETAAGGDNDDEEEAMDYDDDAGDEYETTQRGSSGTKLPQHQPATLGKLHETDLGPDSKMRSIARTEEATRRLAGGR